MQELAERAAPILWFSRDEWLSRNGHTIPEPLPHDPNQTVEPVVYYRTYVVGARPKPDQPCLYSYTPGYVDFTIDYFFYFSEDIGPGCHQNDLEGISINIRLVPFHDRTPKEVAAYVSSVIGWAHGSDLYDNRLDLTKEFAAFDVSLPVTVLVEENKHATAPDRNGDGELTLGYDINRAVRDAWGIRDSFASGLAGASYESYMTKRRWPKDRLKARGQLPGSNFRSPYGWPKAEYSLRILPDWNPSPTQGSLFCKRVTKLSDLFRDKRVGQPKGPPPRRFRKVVDVGEAVVDNLAGRYSQSSGVRSVSILTRASGWDMDLLGGGTLGYQQELWIPLESDRREFAGLASAFYTPSLSAFVSWTVAGGVGWQRSETTDAPFGFVEVGLQFRLTAKRLVFGIVGQRRPDRWLLQFEVGRRPVAGNVAVGKRAEPYQR
jgi:hypothetical protein